MRTKEKLLQELSDCVADMEEELVIEVAEEYIGAGYPAMEGILKGLVDGMKKASELYEQEEYFVPELLLCSEAMYKGLAVLRPHLEQGSKEAKAKVVIGVVEGDTHDIGKNLVRIMLETAGYEMYDLGRNVPLHNFVDKAKEVQAEVIAMSTLMSTTMPGIKKVIEMLKEEGIRDQVKVVIGGAPISRAFAKKVEADGYAANATETVILVDRLVQAQW